jgi:hypothetical protein
MINSSQMTMAELQLRSVPENFEPVTLQQLDLFLTEQHTNPVEVLDFIERAIYTQGLMRQLRGTERLAAFQQLVERFNSAAEPSDELEAEWYSSVVDEARTAIKLQLDARVFEEDPTRIQSNEAKAAQNTLTWAGDRYKSQAS